MDFVATKIGIGYCNWLLFVSLLRTLYKTEVSIKVCHMVDLLHLSLSIIAVVYVECTRRNSCELAVNMRRLWSACKLKRQ